MEHETLKTENSEEEYQMNDSGFSTSDAVLTAAMSGGLGGGGRGGYGGGGAWGGGYGGGGHRVYADAGSNAVRINRADQRIEDQADCTREVLGGAIDGMNNSFESLARQSQFNELKDGQFRAELRNSDQIAALKDTVNANAIVAANTASANAAAAAKCCCDAALENCKQHSELRAEILAVESRGILRDNASLQAELTALKTVTALSTNGHGGH